MPGIMSGIRFPYTSSLIIITGARPQAPRQRVSLIVNRPSALVLYRVATYFFPFLLSVIVFLCEENRSLKGFDAQSAE